MKRLLDWILGFFNLRTVATLPSLSVLCREDEERKPRTITCDNCGNIGLWKYSYQTDCGLVTCDRCYVCECAICEHDEL